MPFDIQKIGEGEWFPFIDSKINMETGEIEWLPIDLESDERVCFRIINSDRFREIQEKYRGKKINIPVLNTLSKAMEIITTYEQTPAQEKAERMEFWNEAITDWNIKDSRDGNPISCTGENKYKLIMGNQRFLRYANKCLGLLSRRSEDIKKKSEKNL
jgi:hypothetical protein